MPEDHFGESIAAQYDDSADEMFDGVVIERTVAFLADLAGGGSALELGVGTGRIALPLQSAGVSVHGIDLSPAMVKRLKTKPSGDRIDVTIGDFATATAPGAPSTEHVNIGSQPHISKHPNQIQNRCVWCLFFPCQTD